MEEIWKDVQGYEGLYQISNFGKVKSLSRLRHCKNGAIKRYSEKNLIGVINNLGYLCYDLYKNKKRVNFKAHRLVALHFCSGFNSKLVVNHIDGNKLNNCYENLEWISSKQNVNHAFKTGLIYRNGFIVLNVLTGIFYSSMGQAYKTETFNLSFSNFKNQLTGKLENKSNFIVI